MTDTQRFSQLQRLDIIIPHDEKGMEHVALKWSPSYVVPVQRVYNLGLVVRDELTSHKDALVRTQTLLSNERPSAPEYIPDILNEVQAYHVKALQEFGRQEHRLEALLQGVRSLCQHRTVFPLDNPASASDAIRCPECMQTHLSGVVAQTNARGSVAHVQHVWGELAKKRSGDVAVAGQRKSRLEEAKALLSSLLTTTADAGILATLTTSIGSELGVIQETLAATKKRRELFELSVEGFMGAFFILKYTADVRGGGMGTLNDETIKELVGEFAVEESAFSLNIKALVATIDIWN